MPKMCSSIPDSEEENHDHGSDSDDGSEDSDDGSEECSAEPPLAHSRGAFFPANEDPESSFESYDGKGMTQKAIY